MTDLAAVYLARPAHGIETFEKFVAAYRRHPAGVPHDLVVIFKGFEGEPAAREAYAGRLAGVPHTPLDLPDVRFDLGAYFTAAATLPHEYVGFFNSYSEPQVEGWLAHLSRHARSPGVGLAGVSGSHESVLSGWYLSNPGLDQMATPKTLLWLDRHLPRRLAGPVTRTLAVPPMPFRDFPAYPNPHVRTTGFVVRRELFAGLRDNPLLEKWDAARLESGRSGLTRQVQKRGLRPVVVGRDGLAYDVADWPKSGTFRLGDQGNLLVSDNHTRYFDAATVPEREWLSKLSWGSAAFAARATRRAG